MGLPSGAHLRVGVGARARVDVDAGGRDHRVAQRLALRCPRVLLGDLGLDVALHLEQAVGLQRSISTCYVSVLDLLDRAHHSVDLGLGQALERVAAVKVHVDRVALARRCGEVRVVVVEGPLLLGLDGQQRGASEDGVEQLALEPHVVVVQGPVGHERHAERLDPRRDAGVERGAAGEVVDGALNRRRGRGRRWG